MKHPAILAICVLLTLAPNVSAKPNSTKSGLDRTHAAMALHRLNLARKPNAMSVSRLDATNSDQGNISVLQDDGSLIIPRNFFDLSGRSLTFTPQANGYLLQAGNATLDAGQGGAVTQPLDDDDSVAVSLPAPFTFYGIAYRTVYVNTDGNLTFGAPDVSSSDRNLSRVVQGAPRIAPLFDDFFPTSSGFVTAETLNDRTIIHWHSISEFDTRSARSTFQVILRTNGTIQFNYSTVNVSRAVVALSPGNSAAFTVTDLSQQTQPTTVAATVAEIFSAVEELDLAAIGQSFYANHPDTFDSLMIFTDFDIDLQDAFAYELPIRNDIQGITLAAGFDFGADFGSAQRLSSIVNAGAVQQYPSDPQQIFLGSNNTLEILGQEFGHLWLAFVDTNPASMLGRDDAHWSFFINSFGSVMEGNEIEDLGNGSFRTSAATYQYSPLDQYIMGLRPASEVPPWFVVENPRLVSAPSGFSCRPLNAACPPAVDVVMQGTRRNITIDDVISVAGPRIPSFETAQKSMTVAFIIITKQNQSTNATNVAHLDRIRAQWGPFFVQAVGGRGSMETTLRSTGPTITSLQPVTALSIGGTPVTILGTNFQSDSIVTIGGKVAVVTSATTDTLQVILPHSDSTGAVAVTVTNPSTAQSVRLANAFTYYATPISLLDLTLPLNGSTVAETAAAAPMVVGYGVIQSALGVAVLRSYAGSSLVSEAAVPATQAATRWVMYAEKGTGVSTGVAIANPGAVPATLVLTLSNGSQTTLQIPAGGQRAVFVDELFDGQPLLGTLTIQSNVAVAVLALRGSQSAAGDFIMATIPLSSALPETGGTTAFPIVADGGGYNTELILVNSAATTSTGSVQFSFAAVTDNGTGNRISFSIPAGAVWKVKTLNSAASVTSGSAVLSVDNGVPMPDATAMIRLSMPGGLISETAIPSQRLRSAGVIFGSFKPDLRTGLAILNPNAEAVQVTLTPRDSNGSLVAASTVVNLSALGGISAFLDEIIRQLPAGFEGTVSLSSALPVYAISLRGTNLSNGNFLMAATPILDVNPPASDPQYYPQVISGGAFSTQFLIGSTGGSPIQLRFVDSNGRPLAIVLR